MALVGGGVQPSEAPDSEGQNGKSMTQFVEFGKTYLIHLGLVALEIAIPIMMVFTVGASLDTQDPERFGLGWLHWTRQESDLERETLFPAYEPSSRAQRNRLEAARASESLAVPVN